METLRQRFETEKWCCRLCHVFCPSEHVRGEGQCRKYPPKRFEDGLTNFPHVYDTFWCGEFTLITFYPGEEDSVYETGIQEDNCRS